MTIRPGEIDVSARARSLARRRRWVLAVALIAFVALAFRYVDVTYDDVFISFRYARNLASGRGLVFNPGERVEGFSNPVWTLLLALPLLLGVGHFELGLLVVAKVLGVACGLATLILLQRTSLRARESSDDRGTAWVALFALASCAPFAAWSIDGLETPMVALTLLAAVSFDLDEARVPHPAALPRSSLLYALAALSRPEPLALFIAAFCVRAVFRFSLRDLALRFAFFAAPFGAYLVFRLGYFGTLLPNTYYAKLYADPFAASRGAAYLDRASDDLGLVAPLALSIALVLLARQPRYRTALLLSLLATGLASARWEGGDWMPGFRLLMPLAPIVALLLQDGFDAGMTLAREGLGPPAQVPLWLEKETRIRAILWSLGRALTRALAPLRVLRPIAPAAVFILFAAMLARASLLGVSTFPLTLIDSGYRHVKLDTLWHFAAGRWLRDHATPGDTVALGEAGVIPWYADLPVIDMFGLVDVHIAHLPGERHHKFDVDYVLARVPTFVVLAGKLDARGELDPIHRHGQLLMKDARFRATYRIVATFDGGVIFRRSVD